MPDKIICKQCDFLYDSELCECPHCFYSGECDKYLNERNEALKKLETETTLRIMAEKFHDVAVKERDFERHLVNGLRRELSQYDCQRTGGPYSDIGGRHCSLKNPCLRCKYEDLETKRADCCIEMEQALEQVAPDWIGDNITDIEACLKAGITEFAIRLLRAKKALEKSREIKDELVDRLVHRDN